MATLFYLAKQIRVNTLASERAEQASRALIQQETSHEFEAVRRDLFSNPYVTGIFIDGLCDPTKLGHADQYAFKQLFGSVVYAFEAQFIVGENVLQDSQQLIRAYFSDLFRYPGARLHWKKEMHLDPQFGDFIQSIFDTTQEASQSELVDDPSLWLPLPNLEDNT